MPRVFLLTALRFALPFGVALLAPAAWGQAPGAAAERDPSPHSDAALVAPVSSIQPAQPFEVVLRITTGPGWHVYWKNPGDSGMPPSLAWDVPRGFRPEAIRFPFPERIVLPPLASYGYEDEAFFFIPVIPPPTWDGDEVTLTAQADWLVCADVCLPATQQVTLTIPVGAASPALDPTWGAAVEAARDRLPMTTGETGWGAEAAHEDGAYTLTLTPPVGWTGTLEGAYFFADTAGVVQHADSQTVAAADGVFRLRVPPSEFAMAPSAQLSGIVVLPEGMAWDGDGHRALAVDVPVAGVEAPAAVAAADSTGVVGLAPEDAGLSLWLALLFAFGGGVLLNLMPCVFPVLSIKLLGFAQGREGRGDDLRLHGWMFAAGVVVSFWVLAGVLLALRQAGAGLGWGFQLQSPGVVAALALLMFVLGLNLAGLFEVGFGLAGIGGRLDRKTGLGGAFLSGVLATVVATPCTAPFMGAALGYALTQPPILSMLVFTALGAGMALPYVLLSTFPRWLDRLPKPGPWMASLKQALAFPLFATTVWLVWVFGQQTGMDGAALLLFALVLAALAGWLVGRWDRTRIARPMHLLTRTIAALAAGLALYATVAGARQGAAPSETAPAATEGAWRAFDPVAIDEIVMEGRPVFVDFTAAWCLSCQVNKRVALHTDAVEQAFRDRGVTTFRADWTNRDPTITAALDALGRSGVPVYALYPGGDAAPVLLPAVLTPAIVIDALDGLSSTGTATASSTP